MASSIRRWVSRCCRHKVVITDENTNSLPRKCKECGKLGAYYLETHRFPNMEPEARDLRGDRYEDTEYWAQYSVEGPTAYTPEMGV